MARLFVSDGHLGAGVGEDNQDPAKERVCRALRALAARGVACFALHGNRDFLLGEGFCERSGCRLLTDPVMAQFDGERVLLTHGDALCNDDHPYHELRSMLPSRAWQPGFLALPRSHRELLADEARAGSRRHTSRTVPYIMDVNAGAVAAAFRAAQVRRMIHGHTHRPGMHEVQTDGGLAQRIVLGAWYEQGSYLSCERGNYQLREL